MAKITIDPVTRVEGHLSIDVDVDASNYVTTAHSTGNLFRGFEKILVGREPKDAVHLTQRICGVCPVSHCMASTAAIEAACGFTPSNQARVLRNLILGGNFIQSHILHFYHLAVLDYIQPGANMEPWVPHYNYTSKVSASNAATIWQHYLDALEARRRAHEMVAIFAGKMPHVATVVPGGISVVPTTADITNFTNQLNWLINFIETKYIPDVQIIATAYPEYYTIGTGNGNLLAYGVFDLDSTGNNKLFKRGIYTGSAVTALDATKIKEYVAYSWYNNTDTNKHPSVGTTTPLTPKTGAYSWLKAPRYNGAAFELGSLARMVINGDYTHGISVMDRHMARALEAKKIAYAMKDWLLQVQTGVKAYTQLTMPSGTVSAVGLTEAARGALGHWLTISAGKISNYQVITPTCWNASPRDDAGVPGPIESAMVGVQVTSSTEPIELLRVVHSYDPCTGCAVHVSGADHQVAGEFVVNPAELG